MRLVFPSAGRLEELALLNRALGYRFTQGGGSGAGTKPPLGPQDYTVSGSAGGQ